MVEGLFEAGDTRAVNKHEPRQGQDMFTTQRTIGRLTDLAGSVC